MCVSVYVGVYVCVYVRYDGYVCVMYCTTHAVRVCGCLDGSACGCVYVCMCVLMCV